MKFSSTLVFVILALLLTTTYAQQCGRQSGKPSLVGVALVVTIVDLAARAIVAKVVPPPCSPMKLSTIVANTWTMVTSTDR
ncbi:hypothetical protein H5410_035641 [Solanum commersonii]|uniref:Uncharacterized protein n=1 Tax=Solanum commersonii TaxID=4109 RepID=A0A9J5Y1V0_SOLCO|nr:hypothetical protein H5410_035641 [Solanum commersonii]